MTRDQYHNQDKHEDLYKYSLYDPNEDFTSPCSLDGVYNSDTPNKWSPIIGFLFLNDPDNNVTITP